MSTPDNPPESVPASKQEAGSTEPVKKGRKLLKSGRDPIEVGKATQIKKGERRNPSGRPKGKPWTRAIMKLMEKRLTKAQLAQVKGSGLTKGSTTADLVASVVVREVLKGRVELVENLIAPRTDGPVPVEVSGLDGGSIKVDVDDKRESARIVAERLRDRILKRTKSA